MVMLYQFYDRGDSGVYYFHFFKAFQLIVVTLC